LRESTHDGFGGRQSREFDGGEAQAAPTSVRGRGLWALRARKKEATIESGTSPGSSGKWDRGCGPWSGKRSEHGYGRGTLSGEIWNAQPSLPPRSRPDLLTSFEFALQLNGVAASLGSGFLGWVIGFGKSTPRDETRACGLLVWPTSFRRRREWDHPTQSGGKPIPNEHPKGKLVLKGKKFARPVSENIR